MLYHKLSDGEGNDRNKRDHGDSIFTEGGISIITSYL